MNSRTRTVLRMTYYLHATSLASQSREAGGPPDPIPWYCWPDKKEYSVPEAVNDNSVRESENPTESEKAPLQTKSSDGMLNDGVSKNSKKAENNSCRDNGDLTADP